MADDVRRGRWAVVSHGSVDDRWAWSGIPTSLTDGLRSHAIDAARVSADLPPPWARLGDGVARRIPKQTVRGQDAGWLVAMRDIRLRRQRLIHEADVIVTLGSTFGQKIDSGDHRGFRVTYEDMTVKQSAHPASPAKDRWIARQRRLYAISDLCCVSTPWVADSVANDYNVPRAKIEVVGLGANILCERSQKNWATPRILWVGVDWHRKGGDLLLEAFSRAAIPDATLDLVGQHPDVHMPGVRGHGVVRDEGRLKTFFEEATLFALPSRFDPSPIVFLEAASAGTPCLGTETAGLSYNVGPSGMVVPVGDVDALVLALIKMTSPTVAASYQQPALEHAERHTWDAVAGRMIEAVVERAPGV